MASVPCRNLRRRKQEELVVDDWSTLPSELLEEIATRIRSVQDFMALRGVCAYWRATITMDKMVPSLSPRIPVLMLPRRVNSGECEFYDISKERVCMRLSIPEVINKRCLEVGFGWLLAVSRTGEVTLLNPLTRAQFQLPNVRTLRTTDQEKLELFDPRLLSVKQGVLSDNPSRVSNFTLVAIHGQGYLLGFWRPGDVVWNRIESSLESFAHVNYLDGKFYVMNNYLDIGIWDGGDLPVGRVWDCPELAPQRRLKQHVYLAKPSSGKGKLLSFLRVWLPYSKKTSFPIFQLNVESNAYEYNKDMGGDALFVGYNAATSFSEPEAISSGIRGHCVYFASHYSINLDTSPDLEMGAKEMGIANLKGRNTSITRFRGVEELSYVAGGDDKYLNPPLWMFSGN